MGILENIKLCANKWTLTIRWKIKLSTNYSLTNHYIYIYIIWEKTGNKSDRMKMFRDKKKKTISRSSEDNILQRSGV